MTAKQIKELRLKLDMTQENFAAIIPATTTTVSRWERSISKPTEIYLRRLEELEAMR
jgi:DNA-binding transcriptional regulator YiaG